MAFVCAGLWFYAGKPWFSAVWALLAIAWVGRSIIYWNKPVEDLCRPLLAQLVVGGLLLVGVIALWFSIQS